jgi:penicillin-binding protein 1A
VQRTEVIASASQVLHYAIAQARKRQGDHTARGIWKTERIAVQICKSSATISLHAWKNIIGDWIQQHWSGKDFPQCSTVITGRVCTGTGKIAVDGCGKGVEGYWKSTNAPYCDGRELGLQDAKVYASDNSGNNSSTGGGH